MKTLCKKNKTVYLLSAVLLIGFCLLERGNAQEMAQDEQVRTLANVEFAVMIKGRQITFTAESDELYNALMIPVLVINDGEFSGILNVTLTKQDSVGEVVALLQKGTGAPEFNYNIGLTPRTISLKATFWYTGVAVIYSTMLYSAESGPYRYTVTLSFN